MAVLGGHWGASAGSEDRETSEESGLSTVCWERLMESPILRPGGNKERELRERERENSGDLTVSSSVRREGSTEATSQGQSMVTPRQEGRIWGSYSWGNLHGLLASPPLKAGNPL